MNDIYDDNDFDEPDGDNFESNVSKKRSFNDTEAIALSTSRDFIGYSYETIDNTSTLFLRCPVGVVSFKHGIHGCNVPNSKPAISSFTNLGYCALSDTSLIKCQLLTGRTHQLRLHLQYLGTE